MIRRGLVGVTYETEQPADNVARDGQSGGVHAGDGGEQQQEREHGRGAWHLRRQREDCSVGERSGLAFIELSHARRREGENAYLYR